MQQLLAVNSDEVSLTDNALILALHDAGWNVLAPETYPNVWAAAGDIPNCLSTGLGILITYRSDAPESTKLAGAALAEELSNVLNEELRPIPDIYNEFMPEPDIILVVTGAHPVSATNK